MNLEALTMVAVFNDGKISIHIDQPQIRNLGMVKTLAAYAAIKGHCEGVISEVSKDLGCDRMEDLLVGVKNIDG